KIRCSGKEHLSAYAEAVSQENPLVTVNTASGLKSAIMWSTKRHLASAFQSSQEPYKRERRLLIKRRFPICNDSYVTPGRRRKRGVRQGLPSNISSLFFGYPESKR